MVPTPKLVRLIALGAPLWLVSLGIGRGWLVGVGYLVLLGLISMRDYGGVPDSAQFHLERSFPRLSLGARASVEVRFVNHFSRPVRVSMRDELPAGLELVTPMGPLVIPARGERTSSYEIRCVRRGRYRLDDAVVRLGLQGALLDRQLRIPASATVRVYPRFSTGDEFRLLARINQQDEAVRRPRRVRGQGTDFESLSQYSPGEDLRRVDWKVSAKRGYLVSRNLQVERGQQISVMIDGGRLMSEEIGEYSRFEYALNAAVMLSYVAQKRGDMIGVATFSDRIESFVPPTRGRAVMPRVLDSLSTVQVRQVESDYWHVVGQIMSMLTRRSLLIMMTDILDSEGSSGLISNMVHAAARHLVVCVVLTEPRVAGIAESAPADLRETYMKAAASHLALERHLALEKMRSRGILIIETPPENLTVDLIRRYLEIRKANLQ